MNESRQLHSEVLIIGGGIHGLSTAFHLAKSGVRVTVLEAEYCARHASGVNAGGVRTLGRHTAEIPLALASRALWHELPSVLGDDGGFVPSGQLKLAETPAELQECRERVQHLQSLGFDHEVLIGADDVFELVPSVARHVVGGIWVKDDGYATPFRTVTAFHHAAERLGVIIHEATPARTIEQRAGRWQVTTPRGTFAADHLVIAAGAWGRELAEQVGETVPGRPEGLMLMVTHRVAPFCAPVLGATGRALSFKQFANGTVVIGGKLIGTLDFSARHGEVDMTRLGTSARTVTDLFPHLRHLGVNRVWAGVEAFTQDDLPVIGASRKASNLSYSFGFCGSGFQMGPGVGKRLAQQILGEHSPLSLDAFAIDRFHPTADAAASHLLPPSNVLHH
ncbi:MULTISPECIES: FAD-binding oxidoreductase [unclassified Pseudomonas]|uniref:NAD(P)/FAD-dependent oxidoreductase n=1 Tax=unclassified Pseudomonas TaxID=196821 RepID=UPI000D3B5A53|nr:MULTISPECIES: FAD-binding oxidoreductase [unclassified Pseudomonas]RAU45711.1 FAD-binding oxidoreductase [Pseudomonas sp. RIT 409]RAU56191.1 FAD-binding oxidoreductase [Pseudomonas sp. RIT 412]